MGPTDTCDSRLRSQFGIKVNDSVCVAANCSVADHDSSIAWASAGRRATCASSSWAILLNHSPVSVSEVACLPRSKRSEEHTSELQSLMRISYACFCLKKKIIHTTTYPT